GVDRQIEGTVAVRGRLQGGWEQPVFHGVGGLRFVKDPGKSRPIQFSIHWEHGGLVAETLGGPAQASGSFYGRLALEPATGLFRLWADLKDTDLTALPGLPGVVAAQMGVNLPSDLQGWVTGVVDLTGRGEDISALRGQISLLARDLALRGETPSGRLEARLTATASRIQIEAFSLQLPGGDITGRGEMALATGALNVPVRAEIRDVTAFAQGFGFRLSGGHATLQGRLIGTRQAPRLQAHVSWSDSQIAGRALDLIDGDVEVSRRILRMSRLTVQSGQSTAILQGSLEASGTTPLRHLDPVRDLVLDVQLQVNPGRTADLLGLLPDDVEVEGTFRATGRIRGTFQSLTGEIGVGLINVRTWEETWQRGEAVFRLRPGDLEIGHIVLRRGAEQLSGEIGIGAGGALRGRLTSTVVNVARVGSLSGSQLAGRATFRLDFQGTLRDTVTVGQATMSTLFYRGIPVGPGTAGFTVKHKAVDVDLTVRQETHRLRIHVGPPGDRSVSGELLLSDANLDLVARLADVQAPLSEPVHGSGRIRFAGQAHASVFGSGDAEFTSVRLHFMGEAWENQGNVQV
ncbi:MAG TPA: hypothetical protein VN203_03355, partial [Candidatus Acidoferrum sp.]|nr:hypothetical protein [Candidatus Acidoferrum sp.]